MKYRNTIFGAMLTLALVCGTVAALPAASLTNMTSGNLFENVYVKTMNMEFTNEDGLQIPVAISSNSDDSRMLIYTNLYGDRQHAVVHKDEDGNFEIKDSTFSEEDAMKIAEIASENDTWREM